MKGGVRVSSGRALDAPVVSGWIGALVKVTLAIIASISVGTVAHKSPREVGAASLSLAGVWFALILQQQLNKASNSEY